VLLAAVVFVAPQEAKAQDVTPPPVLVSFSANPSTVVAGSSVTLTWHLTDTAGINNTDLAITQPGRTVGVGCLGPPTVSGPATDRIWSEVCPISSAALNGTYTVTWSASDMAGNVVNKQPAGTFMVTGGAGITTPPVVVAFSETPSTITVGSPVTFTWHLTSPAGIELTSVGVIKPDDYYYDCGTWATLVSGSPTDGVWSQSCQIDPVQSDGTLTTNGTYTVDLRALDTVWNQLYEPSVATFTVTGAPDEPAWMSFSADPSTVAAGSSVTFSWRLTGGAGVASTDLSISGVKSPGFDCGGAVPSLVSGSPVDGVWSEACPVPLGTQPGDYIVTVEATDYYGNLILYQSSGSFRVAGTTPPAPTITSFTPTSGAAGSSVQIRGENLSDATSVTFNDTPAAFTVNSFTNITATVPSGASTGPISITTPEGSGSSSTAFTVNPVPPTISAFTPTSGPAGTTVVDIQGAGLTGATRVTFNGTQASYSVESDSHLGATVPAGAKTGPISVTTPAGTTTTSSSFTVIVIRPPRISGFSPASGQAGRQVVITGSNFAGTTSIKLGTTLAKFTRKSSTTITAVVPRISRGYYKWSVTTSSGTATSTGSFQVR
jgi:hypothetical protein